MPHTQQTNGANDVRGIDVKVLQDRVDNVVEGSGEGATAEQRAHALRGLELVLSALALQRSGGFVNLGLGVAGASGQGCLLREGRGQAGAGEGQNGDE